MLKSGNKLRCKHDEVTIPCGVAFIGINILNITERKKVANDQTIWQFSDIYDT